MKNNLFVFVFILFATSSFSQNLLEEHEGKVKSITFISYSGTTDKVEKKIEKTFEYFENGLLSKAKYKSSQTNYELKDENLIMKSSDKTNCIQSYEIIKSEKEHIFRASDISIGKSECAYPPEYPIFGRLNFDTLFKDVEMKINKTGKEYFMTVRKFLDEDSTLDLVYWGSFRSNQLKLSAITQREMLSEDLVIKRVYGRSGSRIILTEQKVEDKHGSYIKDLDNKSFFTDGQGAAPRYDYEYDEKGNWIKRTPKSLKEGSVSFLERKITYHQD